MGSKDPEVRAEEARRVEPRASYRIQLHAGFDFEAAAGIVDYLACLGISHLYCSPYLQAVPGSTHGYDVIDPTAVSEELGGESGRVGLCEALASRGMGQMLDIVPNHMSTASGNRWWWDVLRRGRDSDAASFFDVDWSPPERRLQGRILLPVLADHVGRVVESGELRVEDEVLRYHDRVFPLRPGTESVSDLQTLLDLQHHRLAWWRAGADDGNYRRFFDIDDLVGVRVEDPKVFEATHRRILDWLADGSLDGLRIDHPDGLRLPAAYLARLRAAAPGAWIVVEKILEAEETLRPWPVDGTTGYDFARCVGALFVDASAEAAFTRLYVERTGESGDYEAVVDEGRRAILGSILHADWRRVTQRFVEVCEASPRWRDWSRPRLKEALGELILGFDVYRSYVAEEGPPDEADAQVIERALARARARRSDLDGSLFDFLGAVMSGALDDEPCGRAAIEARMQLQQLTGPVRAKGVEDTAFYRHLRFVALNEVGGSPDRFGAADAGEFHAHCQRIQADWPRTMLGLSSHDSKRSEDVRARLYALSETPERWEILVRRWMTRHASHRRAGPWPDAATEYLIYQTLVGAWPLSLERALAYFEKATREARAHTSWTDPDPAYEEDLAHFVGALYEDEVFRGELEELVALLQRPGRINSLAQKLLQLTAPGVPDLYQGSELWDLSLVDPDNRRAVDFDLRRRLLRELEGLDAEAVWARADEGLPKLWVVSKALGVRARRPAAFGPKAGYEPLVAEGEASEHVVAYCRGGEVLPIVPRKIIGLEGGGGFRGTTLELPAGRWSDALSGAVHRSGPVRLDEVLGQFPAALLVRDEGGA